MIKSDFNAMSKQELKAYVLEHRDGLGCLRSIVQPSIANSRVVRFPFANTDLEWQQQETLHSLLEPYSKPDSVG